ncbi:hypothetical protein Vadar_007492 [Vaccinium darrowii]|uniref:Uncharacterized protein n=1 Tax=Vaccinium darrowii TaxID=229202 RepID=A0ACB7X839_9ERIC|nr:hypothetical protein Vadar_007492 [Vaccinium darrowii]
MSGFFDLEEVGSHSSGSFIGSEFTEERLDIHPPLVLPPLPENRDRSGSILRLSNCVWMLGERRMERLLVGQFLDQDLEHAYGRGPWLIRGGLSVLDYWHMYDALEHIRVCRFAMWVPLHNLPFEAFTREAGEVMGQALGTDVTVDIDDFFPRQFRYLLVCLYHS